MLEVAGVTVHAGSRVLLDGVGFEANRGEIIGIVGPNGAGKTTLLEVLVGMQRDGTSRVTLQGKRLQRFRDKARAFAYLPDSVEFPPELAVREVVAHALRFRPRAVPLTDALLATLRLEGLMDRPSGLLSRGERQRVALFCVLVLDRPVVILDEPFNAFDPLQLRDVLSAVSRVAKEGATVIATLHQLRDAELLANRVLLLSGGRRVAWGDLEALRQHAGRPGADLEEVFVALLERSARAT
jgi:ABC-2 type transport system ATP-binding protein